MIWRAFLILLLALAAPASAQSVKLQAHEIEILLSGNTAIGKWDGTAYRQFFDPDGSTIYAQKDARSTVGKWRVDATRDEYQSVWPRDAEWEGWYVMEYAGDFYWVSKSTPPTPFKMLDGQQLIVQESQVCQRIRTFVKQTASVQSVISKGEIDLPSLFSTKADCGVSMSMAGVNSGHCAWRFDYRAAEATKAYEGLAAELASCAEPAPLKKIGKTVNHPDSFEQRRFRFAGGTVSVSLKDKGALQETYVFLRAQLRR